MVDLGFLLITFFIFTTSMAEQKGLELAVPNGGPSTPTPASKTLTFLLGKNNKVFAYEGLWSDAVKNKTIAITNYNVYAGMGTLIRQKQKNLNTDRDNLEVIIKPTDAATFQNTINALDEMSINCVKRYALLDPTAAEASYLKEHF